MSATTMAKRKSVARPLLALLIVAALVAFMVNWSPFSARADDASVTDGATSSEVAADSNADAAQAEAEAAQAQADADAAAAQAKADADAKAAADAEAAKAQADADAAAAAEADAAAKAAEQANVADPSTEVVESTTDAASNTVAPSEVPVTPAADELADRPNAETGVTADGKSLYLNALSGDFTDWTLVIYGPDNDPVLEGFALELGGEYTFRVYETGWYQMALVHPELDSIGAGDFYVEIPGVPVGSPYVNVDNEKAVGSVEQGTVSFDYTVADSIKDTTVRILVYPSGSQTAVAQRDVPVSGSGSASEDFGLPAGEYCAQLEAVHNRGNNTTSWGSVSDCMPFTVTEKPAAGEPIPPTVTGNAVNIVDQPDFVFYDKDTKEPVVNGDTIEEGQTLCIKAKSTDPYGKKGKWGPWCFEYLPKDGVKVKYEVVNDCTAEVKAKQRFEAPVTYTRGADGKVTKTVGDFVPVGAPVPLDPEVPLTEEELSDCPGGEDVYAKNWYISASCVAGNELAEVFASVVLWNPGGLSREELELYVIDDGNNENARVLNFVDSELVGDGHEVFYFSGAYAAGERRFTVSLGGWAPLPTEKVTIPDCSTDVPGTPGNPGDGGTTTPGGSDKGQTGNGAQAAVKGELPKTGSEPLVVFAALGLMTVLFAGGFGLKQLDRRRQAGRVTI